MPVDPMEILAWIAEREAHSPGESGKRSTSRGYATVEPSGSGFEWVCRPCFDDFADEVEFVVVSSPPDGS